MTEKTFEHTGGGSRRGENWFAGWVERKELKMAGNGYWERTAYGVRDVYAAGRAGEMEEYEQEGRRVGWAALLEGWTVEGPRTRSGC